MFNEAIDMIQKGHYDNKEGNIYTINNKRYMLIKTTNSVLQHDFKGDGEYIVVELVKPRTLLQKLSKYLLDMLTIVAMLIVINTIVVTCSRLFI